MTFVNESLPARVRPLPIRIKALTKRYGSVTALDAVDLDIEAGEFLTLLGPSGSGKTTLLMVLAGFVRPDAGSICLGGDEIVLTPPNKRDIGLVFQNYALFPHMNVFGNIAFGLRQRRVAEPEIRRRVQQVLDLVQLQNLSERRIDQLSGGQKQRVALARAIVFEPRILLMDEPLSALDKKLREQMQIELRRLHRALGVTTIYVTHDQREAITMSDRIAVMNHGRIVQLDTPKNLYSRPGTRFVAEFIGESNLLPILIDERGAVFRGKVLTVGCKAVPENSRAWLVIRPEKLVLLDKGFDDASLSVFEGRLAEAVYQGESILLYAALGDGSQLAARVYIRGETLTRLPQIGSTIRLGIKPDDTTIVYEDKTS
jgi:putative spermidine/putrescine transport system ATP-binding protein